jgi:hypothetical protein
MLNAEPHGEQTAAHRIIDFHEVFSLPRVFLEAFARFFMRVGLPTPVTPAW